MFKQQIQFEKLVIVGVGLIGGSIAAAAKARGVVRSVIGHGRNRQRLEAAHERGIIDEISTDETSLADADLIVVCTPVDRIAEDVCAALAASQASTLVTDVGSVKSSILRSVEASASDSFRFIPAHPLAGSHLTGFENADPQLYAGRKCVLTPSSKNLPESIQKIHEFWTSLGMDVSTMSADEHDRVLALTSHLPHLAATAVAAIVPEENLNYASTGYRDTTRVAAGDPDLWTAIFSQNSAQLVEVTDQLIESLRRFRNSLTLGREEDLKTFLKLAQDRRQAFREQDNLHDAE